ncbi:hypothetical protein ES332_A03G096700v1 [Gossypium tomentosum]|uniref:Uncharacterized protein n=1 Tax=Gossypium tomentosum TaxID=34277 RepID=A0A5D2R7N5_GOSTO|nr:hypothetical protein ES332_A03G096700v1 [Gossypium tomentosum]
MCAFFSRLGGITHCYVFRQAADVLLAKGYRGLHLPMRFWDQGCIGFFGTHYHVWAVKMIVYLRSLGLWKVVETDEDPPALRQNPTIAQLKAYDEEILKKDKALTCIHSGLVDHIFTSIMDLETPKAIWN